MSINRSEVTALLLDVARRLQENPNEYVMMLLPARSFLGPDIAGSDRLIFKDRWGEASIGGSVGVVVVTNACDNRAQLRDECIKTGKVFVNVDVVGIGQLKKTLRPLMRNWSPPKVVTPGQSPAVIGQSTMPAANPVSVATGPAASTPPATEPVVMPRIPLSSDGKVMPGQLSALVDMEIAEHGVFDYRKDPSGYAAAIARLGREVKDQGFGPRTNRNSIVAVYWKRTKGSSKTDPSGGSSATTTDFTEAIPRVSTEEEEVDGNDLASDGKTKPGKLRGLILKEIEANGVFSSWDNPSGFKASIDRIVACAAARGFPCKRPSILKAYSGAVEWYRAHRPVAATVATPASPVAETVPAPVESVPAPASQVTPLAMQESTEFSEEDIGAVLVQGLGDFNTAKDLYDEAYLALQAVIGRVQLELTSRAIGKAGALEEAERQIESLRREAAERSDRIAELELAISRLDNEIRKGQESTAQAAKIPGLEAQLKIYKGIEDMFPQLRIMRENAEAMSRQFPNPPAGS